MSVTELAKRLGITKGRVSQLVNAGMPTSSVESAQAWREARPGGQQLKTAPSVAPQEEVGALVPSIAERHRLDGVDDQGELPGDKSNNPYDALRQAKQAEDVAWEQIKNLKGPSLGTDPQAMGALQRTFTQAQKHRMWMQKEVRLWAHAQGVTMYADEAKRLYELGLASIIHHLDMMGDKVSTMCHDPKTAKQAIDDYVNKIKKLAQRSIKEEDDSGSPEL